MLTPSPIHRKSSSAASVTPPLSDSPTQNPHPAPYLYTVLIDRPDDCVADEIHVASSRKHTTPKTRSNTKALPPAAAVSVCPLHPAKTKNNTRRPNIVNGSFHVTPSGHDIHQDGEPVAVPINRPQKWNRSSRESFKKFVARQDFIDQQKAYFKEIDEYELYVEEVD